VTLLLFINGPAAQVAGASLCASLCASPLVRGASLLALRLGLSPLVMGLTGCAVMAVQRHDGADAVGDAMLGLVLALTIVTLGVTMLRRAAG
jgi:hypothetical protein